jgi:two-component system cell cycle response regulator
MNAPLSLALLGFSAFERSTIEAFIRTSEARRLRQAGQQAARFVFVGDTAEAHIVLVDAANDASMRDAGTSPGRCIYIGGRGSPGQLAHLPRPLSLAALLKALSLCTDELLGAPAPLQDSSDSASKPVAHTVVPLSARPPIDVRSLNALPANPSAHDVASEKSAPRRILVVDDSDVAQRFMVNCLGRFGFDVQRALTGEEALSCVAAETYAFVFMDVNMPGIDGYQACKLIKKRPYPAGRAAPVVVMLTSRGGMLDKVRGTLSYCDAYLTKPLQLEALTKILGSGITSAFGEQHAGGAAARAI